MNFMPINPNFVYLCQGKTRKSASDVAAHRLGRVEAYLTVREVLSEASAAVFTGVGMQNLGSY